MDTLTNKTSLNFGYLSRYQGLYSYYDTVNDDTICGLGKPMLKTTAWSAYKVKPEDTLDSLALTYYNNPTYWWVIAQFNDIDPFEPLSKYDTIKIPGISSIVFGDLR